MPTHSIQVDDEVWAAVVGRINGFDLTPNEILRQVFGITSPSHTLPLAELEGTTLRVHTEQTLAEFLRYEQFQQLDRAVRQIPHTSYWALTTLDNKSKGQVIEYILRALGHSSGDIACVLGQFSHSDNKNNGSQLPMLNS